MRTRSQILKQLAQLVLVIVVLATSCTNSAPQQAAPNVTDPDAVTLETTAPTPVADISPAPEPTATPGFIDRRPNTERALEVAQRPAPLGTYVVARRDAGIGRATVPGQRSEREIPVYDEPFGPPRTLLDVNAVDGVELPVRLINWDDPDGVLVMRVIAGGPDDDWLLVQAPVRPHDSYVWVRRTDFDFAFTTKRIEIDLAGEGSLHVFDDKDLIFESPIVHGRESRPTPTHLTYLQKGIIGSRVSPAYGELILSMASFSESLGTFGAGGLPSNFIHGTNQPELMGQRVSSGSIRMPNENLLEFADLVVPGTPVLMFDSSGDWAQIFTRPILPAGTIEFGLGGQPPQRETIRATPVSGDNTTGITPEIWRRCELGGSRSEIDETSQEVLAEEIESETGVPVDLSTGQPLICRNENTKAEFVTPGSENVHVYAVALPNAGERFITTPGVVDPQDLPQPMIPVFDEPDGSPRALVYSNDIDNVTLDYPLYPETVFGEPTVLGVIKMSRDGQWLFVRAPVLPHNTGVWVRGQDFELRSTTLRIEVDLGYEFLGNTGIMTVWDGHVELMSAKISSGRESRPTVETSTHIDQIIAGDDLAPAYGPWIFSTPSYSESLGTFGGGGIPQQAFHGVAGPNDDNLGMPASSGSIHMSYDDILRMAEIDLLGAAVYFYDSRWGLGEQAIRNSPVTIAETIPINLVDPESPVSVFT